MQEGCKIYGMDYLYELSRGTIRRSTAAKPVKESLAYSLNCLYRLYGGADENFAADATQCGLYELAYRIVTLSSATPELKSLWYIYFPYVLLTGAPHDEGIYEELQAELTTDEVFEAVLKSRYCEMVFDSAEEAAAEGVDPLVIDWYAPFNAYKFSDDGNGQMRAVAMLKHELALKNADYVARMAERFLRLFPADETLILLYAAATAERLGGKSQAERESIVLDLLEFIEAAGPTAVHIPAELSYYRGLCFLGLRRVDEALDAFRTCLDYKPGYESALLMIKAIEQHLR